MALQSAYSTAAAWAGGEGVLRRGRTWERSKSVRAYGIKTPAMVFRASIALESPHGKAACSSDSSGMASTRNARAVVGGETSSAAVLCGAG